MAYRALVVHTHTQCLRGYWIKFGFSSSHWKPFTLSPTLEVTSAASVWAEMFGNKSERFGSSALKKVPWIGTTTHALFLIVILIMSFWKGLASADSEVYIFSYSSSLKCH